MKRSEINSLIIFLLEFSKWVQRIRDEENNLIRAKLISKLSFITRRSHYKLSSKEISKAMALR